MVCVGSVLRVLSNEQEPALKVGAPQTLFGTRPPGGIGLFGAVQSYFCDVAHDGQRFLVTAKGADVHRRRRWSSTGCRLQQDNARKVPTVVLEEGFL